MNPIRVALVAGALLAAAIPATLTFASAEDPVASPSAFPPLPWSQHYFDDGLLPGQTGWFLVPVSVDQPAYVRFESNVYTGGSGERTLWAMLLMIEETGMYPILGTGDSQLQSVASVSHGGETVRCCEGMWTSYSYSWGEGPEVTIPMSPGQIAWFGFAADGWGEWDDAHFQVSGQAFITVGDPRTGARVEAVDLYEKALEQGTHAKLFGSDLVALPDDAEVTWTSEDYGIFLAEAYAWDGRGAKLTIEMPGEDATTYEIDSESYVYASAHRAGTYRVSLTDVETPHPGTMWPTMRAVALFIDVDVRGNSAYLPSEA